MKEGSPVRGVHDQASYQQRRYATEGEDQKSAQEAPVSADMAPKSGPPTWVRCER